MIHDEFDNEVPDGAALFPLIPAELGVDPLLLGLLHAIVFFLGSSEEVVHPAAAEEALQYIVSYMQRLDGDRLKKVREDLESLVAFARHDEWPKRDVEFLRSFLKEFGVGE